MHTTPAVGLRTRHAAATLAAAAAIFAAAPTRAAVSPQALEALQSAFVRYAAGGRSNVHITLAVSGSFASARVRPRADGSFACEVAGLAPPAPSGADSRQRRLWTGVLIHEVTHCLTSPYLTDLQRPDDEAGAPAANLLLLLTQESISDARAVIEIFRRDGLDAAREFVSMALPARRRTASAGHNTVRALQSALDFVARKESAPGSDTDSFSAAVRLGADAAMLTWRDTLAARGSTELLSTTEVAAVAAALPAALGRANRAFRSAGLPNNAATVRAAVDALTPGDRHVFVGTDGATTATSAIGMETAHTLADLQALVASSDAPEHRLAIAWLQREGQLDSANLIRCRGAFRRVLAAFGRGSPAQAERAHSLLGDVVTRAPRGTGLSALLEEAVDALKSLDAQSG